MSENGDLEIGSGQHFYRIGQVCRLTDVKSFTLRYWESEFPSLQPVKSPKGHRLYRREDVQTVLHIKRLLYDEGFTIAGARRYLRDSAPVAPGEDLPEFHEQPARAATVAHAPIAHEAPEVDEMEEEESESQFAGASATHHAEFAPQEAGGAPAHHEATVPDRHEVAGAPRSDAANMLSRRLLLDLRDSLRAFLTLLENE